MKYHLFFPSVALAVCLFPIAAGAITYDSALATRMRGRILLQVESHGEAWYIRSKDLKRYYMKDGAAAYSVMRFFSQGITDVDLAKIPYVLNTDEMKASSSVCASSSLGNRLRGEILLQVQQHGEAWYVDPVKCRAIYMKDGVVAYGVMRFLGLGIFTRDLEKIQDGTSDLPIAEQSVQTPATPTPQTDRESMLVILKTNASTEWGTDYQMVQYEYNNQVQAYDWVVAQTDYPAVMTKAESEWGTDYQMVKYEYNNQVAAYEWITAQTAYPDIMTRAKQKWGTDYQMVKYEYNNQVAAYESL